MEKILFLSIKPEYAQKIFNGEKKVELRRVGPKIKAGDLVAIYVSSPLKALQGAFIVEKILVKKPEELWLEIKDRAGETYAEYEEYFQEAKLAYALFIKTVYKFSKEISLAELRKIYPNFYPPQSYRYLKKEDKKTRKLYNLIEKEVKTFK